MQQEFLTPEMIGVLVETGGTPAIVLLVIWRWWNGTSKRIDGITKKINEIVTRLVRIETILEERDE